MTLTQEELASALAANVERTKTHTEILNRLETRVNDLARPVAELTVKQNSIVQDIGEIKEDVKNLVEKPARRWESVVEKVLLTVIAGIVTWILIKIGIA